MQEMQYVSLKQDLHDEGQLAHVLLLEYFPYGHGMHWPPLNYPSEHERHWSKEHVVQFDPNFTVQDTQERPLRLNVVDGQVLKHLLS